MTHKESLLSPIAIFNYFIILVWPWISLKKESYWIWSLRTTSNQYGNNSVLVPPHKPPDHLKDIYNGHTYELKTRVDIWTSVDVVSVEYGTFAQTFHLARWFFKFITGINCKWDYIILRVINPLLLIGLWTKLRIYRVPPDPVRWSFRGFGF